MKTVKTQVLIIGGGAAGLSAALNLNTQDVILIEKNQSNSLLSSWNLMIKPKEKLRKEILKAGNRMNNLKLVKFFLEKTKEAVKDLKNIGIKFRKSNIGLVPNYHLPGLEVRKIFLKKLKKRGIKILKGEVRRFLIDLNKKIRGVEIVVLDSKEKIRIFFNYLLLASGGLGGFFKFRTGTKDCDGSILSLCYEAGLKLRDLEFFMFHPFLVIDKRLPHFLISGDILRKMEYENEKGNNFLSKKIARALKTNKHHYVFPQMTKEFYLQSLKGKIFGKLTCSHRWFENFKKKNEFGFVFKGFQKNDLKRIEIHPAFHFSIGGVAINEKAQTSQEDIYAAGEITGGLYGSNRIGGLAILEAIIFGKKAALEINKKMQSPKEVLIPEKIKGIGKLGFSEKIKEKVWEVLGPVKRKENLELLNSFLKKKKKLSSQEKLLKKIVEISLLRKESIGAFYREDLKEKQTAPSSFLINKKIIFKK